MEPIFFEKLIVRLLFTSNEDREKIYPYLTSEVFEDFSNQKIVEQFLKFKNDYDKFPTVKELEVFIQSKEVFQSLKEIMGMDTSDYGDEYIRDEIESFFKQKMVWNNVNDIVNGLKENDLDSIGNAPDKLRESMSFSFDTTVGLDMKSDCDRLYDSLHNKDKVISSGIKNIDRLIEGGFHEKSLTLFMAETNMGKSLIKCGLATNCLLQNKNVLYISCEMSEDKISERIMANLFDIELDNLKHIPKDRFYQKYENVMKPINGNLVVKEYPTKSLNTNKIRNLCKELKMKKNFVPDIIFVDYLGIMIPNMIKREGNSNTELKTISEELRGLAVELKIPIVSAVQTNRGGFSSAEIDLTDIADSIGTTATADVIFGITQTDELRAAGLYTFILLKNRYGINKMKISVGVDYPKMRVYEVNDQQGSNTLNEPQPINIVDDAVVQIKETIKNNKKIERKKIIDIDFN